MLYTTSKDDRWGARWQAAGGWLQDSDSLAAQVPDSQTQTQIVESLECQHFPPVQVWLTESRSCLDQLATITTSAPDMVI